MYRRGTGHLARFRAKVDSRTHEDECSCDHLGQDAYATPRRAAFDSHEMAGGAYEDPR